MERQSEDLARLLTASTVAAASALAASLGAHKVAPPTVQAPFKEASKHESKASSSSPSSSSTTASHISSFESDGGTPVPATTNESQSPLPRSKETHVTEKTHSEPDMTEGGGSGQSSYHEKDASSDSVSEELGALEMSGELKPVPFCFFHFISFGFVLFCFAIVVVNWVSIFKCLLACDTFSTSNLIAAEVGRLNETSMIIIYTA